MISNEDYKNIKDGCSKLSPLNILYRYFVETTGSRIQPSAFMMKFTIWVQRYHGRSVDQAIEEIVNYLDRKHEYQGFIENWK